MNNDLISREALKNHIIDIFDEEVKHDKKWAMGLKYSLKIIDLAPTVEFEPVSERQKRALAIVDALTEKRLINVMERGCLRRSILLEPERPQDESKTVQDCIIAYGDGFESARRLFERPHGEWVKPKERMTGTITTIYKCSECGRTIATMPNRLVKYPFCHCGADMRKGEKE